MSKQGQMSRTDVVLEISLIVIQTDGPFKQKPTKTDKSFQIVAKATQLLGLLVQV
jgi:hypothetical protein